MSDQYTTIVAVVDPVATHEAARPEKLGDVPRWVATHPLHIDSYPAWGRCGTANVFACTRHAALVVLGGGHDAPLDTRWGNASFAAKEISDGILRATGGHRESHTIGAHALMGGLLDVAGGTRFSAPTRFHCARLGYVVFDAALFLRWAGHALRLSTGDVRITIGAPLSVVQIEGWGWSLWAMPLDPGHRLTPRNHGPDLLRGAR
jgi:hypothetical protein